MEWQPIETAHKAKGFLLLWYPVLAFGEWDGMYCIGLWSEKEQRWVNAHNINSQFDREPTHWMPLPEPPVNPPRDSEGATTGLTVR
jgi:Protein of unknown function (DUF551)